LKSPVPAPLRHDSNLSREAIIEHQFMQRLRGAGRVNATALPPSRRLVQTLLQKGWIKATRSGPKNVVLYRLTEEGLNAKKLPIPIPQRRRPSSKGKISD
jgi:hypothetical protein